MMIPSNYEVSVAKNAHNDGIVWKHYCKIELGSLLEEDAKQKARELQNIFGDQFKITLMYIYCEGSTLGF